MRPSRVDGTAVARRRSLTGRSSWPWAAIPVDCRGDGAGRLHHKNLYHHRNPGRASNADLSNLAVSQGTLSPAFTTATTSYTDSVINSVTGMTVTPTASDINATIRVGGTIVTSPGPRVSPSVGSNAINVVVTAQDGSTTKQIPSPSPALQRPPTMPT